MNVPFTPDYRISDAERQYAMDQLGTHFAAGRLSIEEYQERIDVTVAATLRSEILPLFDDLPALTAAGAPPASTGVPATIDGVYTIEEIDEVYRNGRNIRAGIVGLVSVGTIGLIAAEVISGAFILLIPMVLILLYVMKVGPKSWHAPSPRALERKRLAQMRILQQQRTLAIQAAASEERAKLRAQRQQIQAELNKNATQLANETIKKLRGRFS